MNGRAELPVRSLGADPAAFTDFYRAHVDEVTQFVARRVADPQLTADLTAEVFLAVIEAAARYRGSFGGPRTWLFGIDAFRKVRELHEKIRTLPESERAVLELVSVDGLTVAEAAVALGIRKGTARVRLHRARRTLLLLLTHPVIEAEVMS